MNKISFDFDSTLSREDVQSYAKELINREFDIWICTSRFESAWNDDLFDVANDLGIKKENIYFCNMSNKSEFLYNKDFIFHIDDDDIELSFIKSDTNVSPIYLTENMNWKSDCENAILKYERN